MKMRFAVLATLAATALAGPALAQTPRGAAVTTLGTNKITIDYGRPALKGRDLNVLMKDLPADRIWRAGENEVTTFTTGAPVSIGGKTVPAGKYSVYVQADEKGAWSLILNSDLGVPLGKIWDKAPDNMKNAPWPYLQGYTKEIGSKEVVRASMKATKPASTADLYTMSFAPKGKDAELTLAWGNEAWSIEVKPAK
jgi:uncharacterized protein (DUF2141 family)